MSTLTGEVTGVYTVTDALSQNFGQTLLNIATGGMDGMVGVVNACPGYARPTVGDNVGLMEFGSGLWAVVACFTPDRGLVVNIPEVPNVTVLNSAPGGWTQISTVYAEPGVLTNPDLALVTAAPFTPPPPSTAGTFQQTAASGHSWRDDFGGSWSNMNGRIYQGRSWEGGYGPWTGVWFYPDMTAALSGKTITGFSIHVCRADAGGWDGPVQLHFFLHNHATQPAGAPTVFTGPTDIDGAAPSRNAPLDIPLPLSWAAAIQSGSAKGIAIAGADEDTYSILLGPDEDPGSGLLTFDYS